MTLPSAGSFVPGSVGLALAERGLVAETVERFGLRRAVRAQLRRLARSPSNAEFAAAMRAGSFAPTSPRPTGSQADVPAAFFEQVLGPHVKYSCAYWPESIDSLGDAEAAMLALTCDRAGLADGQRILELGCGWGALSLWMARRYPDSRIVAVADSHAQRAFIEARRPHNLEVVTADPTAYATRRRFDRVMTVETFERLWNWEVSLSRIAGWLAPEGRLFIHVGCQARHAYVFEPDGLPGWRTCPGSARAIMPSADLIDEFGSHFSVEERWLVGGEHYARTAEAWRVQLEARREWVLPILSGCFGQEAAARWYHRWRLSFLARAELFSYGGGTEWGVAHYRLSTR